jgi:hypothetical protein
MVKKTIVVLLILPMALVLAAQGNKEAGKGQGILLEDNFAELLGELESGEITPEEAREELANMQNRFTFRNEEGKILDGLPDQLRDRDQIRIDEPGRDRAKDQDKTQDKLKDQDKDQDCEPDRDRIGDQTGSGSSSGPSGKKKS